jgi:hypothetical protein
MLTPKGPSAYDFRRDAEAAMASDPHMHRFPAIYTCFERNSESAAHFEGSTRN